MIFFWILVWNLLSKQRIGNYNHFSWITLRSWNLWKCVFLTATLKLCVTPEQLNYVLSFLSFYDLPFFFTLHNLSCPYDNVSILLIMDRIVWQYTKSDIWLWTKTCLQYQKTKVGRHSHILVLFCHLMSCAHQQEPQKHPHVKNVDQNISLDKLKPVILDTVYVMDIPMI